MNQPIILSISSELLQKELTPDKFLRFTNKGGNEIYIVDAFEAPNVMCEVGRLREIAFRLAGGGTGKECDIDEFDIMDTPCKQMIVWNPEHKMILGGYRFILGPDIKILPNGQPNIATSHMFHFSDRFIRDYLPNTLELGRSFVRIELQSTRRGSQSIYVLDNLWDGLGALTVKHPEIKYLFGKVTMYPDYSSQCRNMILHFLNKYFPDPDRLIYPISPLDTKADTKELDALFQSGNFKDDYRILNTKVRELGFNIPPLV
ncbi:MAG: GNAT family N-acetyltransferase, partial [Muribaculaceae bacterium]|nr:GNAT family N-acetyltransferase [Muribaculaceae bacterium]